MRAILSLTMFMLCGVQAAQAADPAISQEEFKEWLGHAQGTVGILQPGDTLPTAPANIQRGCVTDCYSQWTQITDLFPVLPVLEGLSILDVGAGSRYFVSFLYAFSKAFSLNMKAIGVDPGIAPEEQAAFDAFVTVANQKFSNTPEAPPARLLPKTLQRLASNLVLRGTQNVVNTNNAFRFMSADDRSSFFADAANMLKPGGLMLMGDSPQVVTRSGVSSVMCVDDPTKGNNTPPLIDYDEEVFAAANKVGLVLYRVSVGTQKEVIATYHIPDGVVSLYGWMNLMVQRGARYFLFGFIKRQESDAEDQVTGDTEGA